MLFDIPNIAFKIAQNLGVCHTKALSVGNQGGFKDDIARQILAAV